MTKDELKALGLTDEQADKIVKDYENYVPKKTMCLKQNTTSRRRP